ncbi:MAG: transketolase, partial [bacterium]
IHAAGSGHPGGSLSMVEILTALFFEILDKKPEDPTWPDRDRLVLSKGHGVPALYSVLARAGYFPVDELMDLRKLGSPLQGHPDYSRLPAVEASTGSLGQGLSIAAGMALAARLQKRDYHTYCLVGDGESNEGQIWEAALFAPQHDLTNLTVIVDYNKYQLDGAVDEILPLEPFVEKWESFNWKTTRVDGHKLDKMIDVLATAKNDSEYPHAIIADTVKGKGISFMAANNDFHGRAPTDKELEQALDELEDKKAGVK